MRSGWIISDWQAFSRLVRHGGEPEIWSRFAVELGPRDIVSPHL